MTIGNLWFTTTTRGCSLGLKFRVDNFICTLMQAQRPDDEGLSVPAHGRRRLPKIRYKVRLDSYVCGECKCRHFAGCLERIM